MRDIEKSRRPWGYFETFIKNQSCTVKLLYVQPSQYLSLQYHKNRDEFWKVRSGPVLVEINGFSKTLMAGETCEIPRGSTHRLSCPNGFNSYGVVLEIATGDFDENDEVRLEDIYGRTINERT